MSELLNLKEVVEHVKRAKERHGYTSKMGITCLALHDALVLVEKDRQEWIACHGDSGWECGDKTALAADTALLPLRAEGWVSDE